MIFFTGRFDRQISKRPDPVVSATFRRIDAENPDKPLEEVLDMCASNFNTNRSEIIRKLWGDK